jgi:hypothetical protein
LGSLRSGLAQTSLKLIFKLSWLSFMQDCSIIIPDATFSAIDD